MAVLLDPFEALASFQQTLDAYRTSSWLDPGLSGGGAFPPLNVFLQSATTSIIIAELPGGEGSLTYRRAGEGPHRQIGGRRNGWLSGEGGAASPRATRRSLRQGRDNAHRDQPGRRQGRIPLTAS